MYGTKVAKWPWIIAQTDVRRATQTCPRLDIINYAHDWLRLLTFAGTQILVDKNLQLSIGFNHTDL